MSALLLDDLEEDDGPAQVIVCQGPPACLLQGDDAVRAQNDGCKFCDRIWVWRDGREERQGPGHAGAQHRKEQAR